MKQSDDNDKDSGAPRQDGPSGGGPVRPDDVEGPLAAGSPRNLLPIAMTVLLLMFAGIVFYIAAVFGDSEGTRDNWSIATTILTYLSYAVFYPGVLVGLGTFATAWSGDRVSAAAGVARLLSWAGAALVVLGVAQAICVVGIGYWGEWRGEASQVAIVVANRVFEGGVLAGLALLCLRRARGR
jgi:hypothetical protein